MNASLRKEWEDFLLSRPEPVREVFNRLCPDGPTCLRSTENRGHYLIHSVDEHRDGSLTIRIVHGKDSYLPGSIVFGVAPDTLTVCDCGDWEPPTKEQIEALEKKIEMIEAFRNAHRN